MTVRLTALTGRTRLQTPMPHGATAAASYIGGVIDYAVSRGAPRERLLRAAGLVAGDLDDPHRRWSIDAMIAVMRTSAELLHDPAFALHLGDAVNCDALTVSALVGASAATVGEALILVGRYAPLGMHFPAMGETPRYHAETDARGVWVTDARPSDAWPEITEAAFARFVRGMRRVGGPTVVRAVHVRHAAPPHAAEYHRVLGAPVRFRAGRNAILVDPAYMAQPLTPAPRHVTQVLATFADQQLAALSRGRLVRGRVEAVLRERLATGDVGVETVACALAMSRQTLYRRLRAEGTTFEQVLDALRHLCAVELLERDGATVTEVAALVGFSEAAAFTRAFKRWTGQTPTDHRRG